MNSNEVKTVELVVNSEQARRKLDELNGKLVEMKQKRQEALDSGNAEHLRIYTKECNKLEREINKISTRADGMRNVLLNIDKASPNALKKTIKEINKELNSGAVERNSEEWKVLTKALREADEELKKIASERKVAEEVGLSTTESFAKWGQKWVGIVTTVQVGMQAITGMKSSMQSAIQDFATMEEAESQVKKYTGLAAEGVHDLNEELKKMDTRTARERLNELAGDAGRLGIQAKDQILEFVEAADQINVALGEDLGEDAVKNIGKLSQLFGDADAMGLKRAMLSTGSAINELAQNSSASEPYILEFTGRLAGASKQAGLTQAHVMGLASTLDQSMVGVEKGATAMQNVLVKLYKEPQKLAVAAGLDVKAFTELLKTDANEALMQFLTALSQKGGLDELAPLFGDMQMSGAGVVQVLSALASNINEVRNQQELATKAFSDGTSITNEFNVQNSTVQAQMDKAKKAFHEVSIELGEELMPLYSSFTGATSTSMKAMIVLTRFVKSHIASLSMLAATIAFLIIKEKVWGTVVKAKDAILLASKTSMMTYRAAMLLTRDAVVGCSLATTRLTAELAGANVVTKLLIMASQLLKVAVSAVTLNFTAARGALTAFNTTLMSTGWGTVLVAVGAFAAGVWGLVESFNDSTEAAEKHRHEMDMVAQANKAAKESTAEEIGQINRLVNLINNNTTSLDMKRAAMSKLQKMMPGWHGALDKEGRLTRNSSKAIKDYIDMLGKKAKAEAYYERMREVDRKLAAAEDKLMRKQFNVTSVEAEINAHPEKYYQVSSSAVSAMNSLSWSVTADKDNEALRKKKEELRTQQAAVEAAKKEVEALKAEGKRLLEATKSNKDIESYYQSLLVSSDASDGGTQSGGSPATEVKNKAYYQKMVDDYQAQYDALTQAERTSSKGAALAQKIRENQRLVDSYSVSKTDAASAKESKKEEQERKRLERAAKTAKTKEEREAAKAELERKRKAREAEKARKEKADKDLKALENELEAAEQKLLQQYASGEISGYDKYLEELYDLQQQYVEKEIALYREGDSERDRLESKKKENEKKRGDASRAWSLHQLDVEYEDERRHLELRYMRHEMTEQQYQESLDMSQLSHLERRLRYLKENGAAADEIEKARSEMAEQENKMRFDREKRLLEDLQEMTEEYARKTPQEQMAIELAMLDRLHEEKLLSEEQYLKMLDQIREKYNGKGGVQDQYDREAAAAALEKARGEERDSWLRSDNEQTFGFVGLASVASKIQQTKATYAKLDELRRSDQISQAQYEAACMELDKERFENFGAMAQAAYASVSALMNSYSELSRANMDAEVAKIESRYDREIEAAGQNSAQSKKLEERKQKEINALKKKELKKSTAIQISQALAGTAMNALLAYQDMLALGLPAGPVLAPIAAAMATAAGMMQVAAIKKQADAQMAEYYSGGFTGGRNYRREAGVVHEGEFVANHGAVNNPNLLPILQLIDRAQKSNTVGSLTASDVSRAISAPAQTAIAATQTASAPLLQVEQMTDRRTSDAIERLNEHLDGGIHAICAIDGDDGVYRLLKKYERMMGRK